MRNQEVIFKDSKLTLKEFIERFDKEQVVVLPTNDLASYKLKKQESKKSIIISIQGLIYIVCFNDNLALLRPKKIPKKQTVQN
jgi:peroxiredoxin